MGRKYLRFPGGLVKAVTLSYDDGNDVDRKLEQKLCEYGLKCTFNINTSKIRKNVGLTADDLRSFVNDGHEIAVHGDSHYANGLVLPVEGIRDVLRCREELEEILGTIIRGMAYPDSGIRRFENCPDYLTVKNYLTSLGIAYARTLGDDNDRFELPRDWHCWIPTAHHGNPKIFEYIDKFINYDPSNKLASQRPAKLFYLWGHAYEFDRKENGWEYLEDICKKLSAHDDVWYATNIEIFDYVTAYRSLVFNSKGTKVYNPTVKPVWIHLGEENKNVVVRPDETVDLV